jgi:hypothetical protein
MKKARAEKALPKNSPRKRVGSGRLVRRWIAYLPSPVRASVKLWRWKGFRLMTHMVFDYDLRGTIRVSEETTGWGIPDSFASTAAEARRRAIVTMLRYEKRLPLEIAIRKKLNGPNNEVSRAP